MSADASASLAPADSEKASTNGATKARTAKKPTLKEITMAAKKANRPAKSSKKKVTKGDDKVAKVDDKDSKADDKTPAGHPSWKDMIKECIAIHKSESRTGVSRAMIKKFVFEKYGLEESNANAGLLSRAIRSGEEQGIFVLPKGSSGRVKLAPKRQASPANENDPATKKPVEKEATKRSSQKEKQADKGKTKDASAKTASTKVAGKKKAATKPAAKPKKTSSAKAEKKAPAAKAAAAKASKKTPAPKAKAVEKPKSKPAAKKPASMKEPTTGSRSSRRVSVSTNKAA